MLLIYLKCNYLEDYEQLVTLTTTAIAVTTSITAYNSITGAPITSSPLEAPTIEPTRSITYNFYHHRHHGKIQVLNQLLNRIQLQHKLPQHVHPSSTTDDRISQPITTSDTPATASTNCNTRWKTMCANDISM